MSKIAYSRTMVDKEIIRWAKNEQWMEKGGIYQNFIETCVHGETYDVRAGDLIIVSEPNGKRNWISLTDKKEVTISPFRSATVQSYEKIKLPLDMYGELWIRNALQHKGLAFTGGDIDPGFWGYLYIKIHNVGPVPVTIRHRQEIASVRFTKLHEAVREPYTIKEITEPREEQLPALPSRILYDWLELSKKLDDLDASLRNIQWFHEKFIVALIASVGFAFIFAILKFIGFFP